MDKIKINFFILKYGAILHTIFVFPILYMADIYANTPMFWAFLLNHIMFVILFWSMAAPWELNKQLI